MRTTSFPMSWRRGRAVTLAATTLLTLAACGGSDAGPGTTTPVTPPKNEIASGTIAASGGSVTVAKPGDALDGLTLTAPAGSFASGLTVSIASLPNTPVPTKDGITAISPRIVVSANQDSLAAKPMTMRIPVRVPAGATPVVAMWDSATGRLVALPTYQADSTAVIALVRNLNPANLAKQVSASIVSNRRSTSAALTTAANTSSTFVTFAIPDAVLMRDYDTGFRPGTHDWDWVPVPTETKVSQSLTDPPAFGALVTAMYSYNTDPTGPTLRSLFPRKAANISYSSRDGIGFAATIDRTVRPAYLQYYAAMQTVLASVPVTGLPTDPVASRDQAAFRQIRAIFALSAMNATRPPTVLVSVAAGTEGFHYVAAYKAVGTQLFVADAMHPGDQARTLQFPTGQRMTPYAALGAQFGTPFPAMLEEVADVRNVLSAGYQLATANPEGIRRSFPEARFSSWFGRVFDTTYVVDSLRVWNECGECKFGFATTLSPRPAANIGNARQVYRMTSGAATDSLGSLGGDGLLINSASVPAGGEITLGFPLGSAPSAGSANVGSTFQWVDWRSLLIRRLEVAMTPAARSVAVNTNLTFALTAPAAKMPTAVNYRWDFKDGTPVVSTNTVANATHAFTTAGVYVVTGEIIDPRNTQVIGRQTTTITVTSDLSYSAWRITPGAVAPVGVVPPADTSNFYLGKARQAYAEISNYWSAPQVAPRVKTLWFVPAPMQVNGEDKGAGLYLSDSLPATPPSGFNPNLYLFGTPTLTAFRTDDPAIRGEWSVSGTPPANATVTAQYLTQNPQPYVPQVCLGDIGTSSQAHYVYHKITFAMAGTTATGTITYYFRAVQPSCLQPRAVTHTWQLTVPFTATRVR